MLTAVAAWEQKREEKWGGGKKPATSKEHNLDIRLITQKVAALEIFPLPRQTLKKIKKQI